ncbi:MAG: leucine-rich repeat protein [Bacteroidales bacterium]|nr:leucine-rich repeat protein [Bacteroidales bacterium]
MKRILYFCLAAGLLTACMTEAVPERTAGKEPRTLSLTAIQEGQPGTRTIIAEETKVFWQPGDEVKVFCDGASARFTSTNAEPAGIATFTGTLQVLVGFNEGFSPDTPLWGLYPYCEDATADNGSVTTTLPDVQLAQAGSFARDMYPTLGRSNSLSMGFWGICGGVRFSLTQEDIRQVEFESLGGEAIAGRIRVAFADGVPAVQEVSDARSTITLTPPAGESFSTGQWYYIVALPGTLEKGFRLTFHQGSRTAEYVSDRAVTIKRTIFGSLKDVDEGLEFQIPGIGNPDDPIPFADEKVKAKLVAAFDRNGDGELSFDEADRVTSMEGVFGTDKDFESFDEFRFFTGVTAIPDRMCRNWTALTSIRLPESLTSMGAHSFYGCTSLRSIVLPEGIRTISRYAFGGCTALEECILGSQVEAFEDWSFYNCTSLVELDWPETLTSLGDNALRNCSSLEFALIPDGVSYVGKNLFYGCKGLQSVRLPASVQSIPDGLFAQCAALEDAPISEGMTSIGNTAFYGCTSFKSLVIPDGMTSIGTNAFSGCTSLTRITVRPATPPTGASGMFSNTGNCPIYVPAATAYMYTEATYWKDYVSRIKTEEGVPPFYTSSDYSRDGEVVTLQQASVGRGVNFVLLGDGYVDRDMEPGGKYEQRMRSAMEALFAYEPYTSLRDRFNVYAVKVVSANAQYDNDQSNRRLTYESGGSIDFRSAVALNYANKAPRGNTGQPVKVAVLCNSTTRVGRSYCLRYTSGQAVCIVFDPNTNVLVHELCGHGFGDLWDEYTEKTETFTDQAGLDRDWNNRQWGANTDWRNDPATIRWAHFLADSRYAGEDLGIFEGAKLYPKGIYRPTNNSMMRHNNCPFNAPSREQIYKNTMKWSEGSTWKYDYETFVALDQAGRSQAAGRLRAPRTRSTEEELDRQHEETHIPPVTVDEGVLEVGFPVSGPAVPHFKRK